MRALIFPHDKRCFCFVCIPCLPIGLSSYPFFIRKIISTNYYRLSCGELAFILYSELNIWHDLKPFKLQVAVALAQSTTGDSLEDSSEFNFNGLFMFLKLVLFMYEISCFCCRQSNQGTIGSLALLLACWRGYIVSWKKKSLRLFIWSVLIKKCTPFGSHELNYECPESTELNESVSVKKCKFSFGRNKNLFFFLELPIEKWEHEFVFTVIIYFLWW